MNRICTDKAYSVSIKHRLNFLLCLTNLIFFYDKVRDSVDAWKAECGTSILTKLFDTASQGIVISKYRKYSLDKGTYCKEDRDNCSDQHNEKNVGTSGLPGVCPRSGII